jgi:hypothetical protein
MIELSYHKDEDIIYVRRSGDIHFQDLIEYVLRLDNEFNAHDRLYILDDTSGSTPRHDHTNNYRQIAEEIKKRISRYTEVKHAIMASSPGNTALNIIFEALTSEIENYHFKVFSTIEASMVWLKQRRE